MIFEWGKMTWYLKFVAVVIFVSVLTFVFYSGREYVDLSHDNKVGEKVGYIKGQYIDEIGKVRLRETECGGGEHCLSVITVLLLEDKSTDDIFESRIDVDLSCVDETLRSGDMARVRGVIENIVPSIGLILSCNSPGTSISREINSTESEYFSYMFNEIKKSYPDIFSGIKQKEFQWYRRNDSVSLPEIKKINGWGMETQYILDSAELDEIFNYRLFFEQSLENTFDGPRGSVWGYVKIIQTNPPTETESTVCLVTAVSDLPPIMGKIQCGFLN